MNIALDGYYLHSWHGVVYDILKKSQDIYIFMVLLLYIWCLLIVLSRFKWWLYPYSQVPKPTPYNIWCCQNSLQWHHDEHDGISNHWHLHCLLNCWITRRSKKTSKLRVTGFCARNSSVTGEFPAQKASNAENVSIWWSQQVIHRHSGNHVNALSKRLVCNHLKFNLKKNDKLSFKG